MRGSRLRPRRLGAAFDCQPGRGLGAYADGLPEDDPYRKRIESITKREMRRTLRDNLLSFAVNEPALSISVDALDARPMLLTVGNGTLELETGTLRESSPGDLLSRWTPLPYVRDAPRDRWLKFLDDIYLGDEELIAYMQRACGLSLTGLYREHKLWIHCGEGRNGKSTFTHMIREALGLDFYRELDFATLSSRKFGRDGSAPTPDLARLRGARLVVAMEQDEQKILDLERIKRLTGGERIVARYLNKNPMEFQIEFKLWIVTNEPPRLNATQDAIRYRLAVVPYLASFPPGEPGTDPDIEQKLLSQREGVLAWMVEGCAKYLREGLGSCPLVEKHTSDYVTTCNPLADTIERGAIELGPQTTEFEVRGGDLMEAIHDDRQLQGLARLSNAELGSALSALGCTRAKDSEGALWRGVRLPKAVLG